MSAKDLTKASGEAGNNGRLSGRGYACPKWRTRVLVCTNASQERDRTRRRFAMEVSTFVTDLVDAAASLCRGCAASSTWP
jgi:hypothetical protein